MILPPEYAWLETCLAADGTWLENTLNWGDICLNAFSDLAFAIHSALTTPIFANSYVFTGSFSKISFLDLLLLLESDKTTVTRELYDSFIWDIAITTQTKYAFLNFLFYADYQDFQTILMHQCPELTTALYDFCETFWFNNTYKQHPATMYDFFNDSLMSVLSEFLENLVLLACFVWLFGLIFNLIRITKLFDSQTAYLSRVIGYLALVTRESRAQFEAILQTFFFFVLYWTMLVATFDDDQEEVIEFFHTICFFFFIMIILFLFYKYSIHYFAFLEASFNEGQNVAMITRQFFRDFINTFALFLRFLILLIRLNVYDSLDDFYDSYYIFVGDFDEEEYLYELFYSYLATVSYDFDTNDDKAYHFVDENEFYFNFFALYLVCWSKFFAFIFFIIEEILRVSLAFYICYLITFEVHAVNASYVEDNYLEIARRRNPADARPGTHVANLK